MKLKGIVQILQIVSFYITETSLGGSKLCFRKIETDFRIIWIDSSLKVHWSILFLFEGNRPYGFQNILICSFFELYIYQYIDEVNEENWQNMFIDR